MHVYYLRTIVRMSCEKHEHSYNNRQPSTETNLLPAMSVYAACSGTCTVVGLPVFSSQMYSTSCISFLYHCTSSSSTQSTIIKQTSRSLQRKHSPRGGLPRSSKTQVYDLRTILRMLNEKHDANNNQQLRYKQMSLVATGAG